MTYWAGVGVLKDNEYTLKNCQKILENREYTTKCLYSLGFTVLPSMANFVFAKTDKMGGEELYTKLKEKGVLIRHFNKERIKDYIRITIGTKKQMATFIQKVKEILEN